MFRTMGRPYDPHRPGERLGPNRFAPTPAPPVAWAMLVIHVTVVVLLTGFLAFHNPIIYVALIVLQSLLFELALIVARRT